MIDGDEAGGNEMYGHENESIEIGSPFAQVFGPEILDANLSDLEFRLLVYLRITAGRNGSTWMSHKQIAKHFGKGVRSIERAYSNLRDKGFAKSWNREWGRSDKKILTAPSKTYGYRPMREFFNYLRADASDEDIAEIRGLSRIDNSPNSNTATFDGTGNDRRNECIDNLPNSNTARSGGINTATFDGINTARSGGTINRSLKTKEDKADHTSSAPPRVRKEIDLLEEDPVTDQNSKDLRTREQKTKDYWKNKPLGEELKNPSDDEREAEAEVRKAEAAALVGAGLMGTGLSPDTKSRIQAKQEALRARQTDRVTGNTPASKEPAERTRRRLTSKEGRTSSDLELVYFPLKADLVPDLRQGRWDIKQKTLAVTLINDYGWELTKGVVEHVFDNWSVIGLKMKNTSPFPSIGWIYACREQLFGEYEKKGKDARERVAVERDLKEGESF